MIAARGYAVRVQCAARVDNIPSCVDWTLTVTTAYLLRWAGTCDKLFLHWRTCTTAYRKLWEVAGKETWFLRQGFEL